MKKPTWLIAVLLMFLTVIYPNVGAFTYDEPSGNFYELLKPLRIGKSRLPACFNFKREASFYYAGVHQLHWYWNSEKEVDARPGHEDVFAAPEVHVPNFSDTSEIWGQFHVNAPAGASIDCSRVSAQVRFKAKIPGPDYSDDPWQSVPMTPGGSSDNRCSFIYRIPVDKVNELFNSLPDVMYGNSLYHELAIFLSAAGPSCTQWYQKYYVTFAEDPDSPTYYVFISKRWDERFGPDPVIQLVP